VQTKDMPHGMVGLKFAQALVRRDFGEAQDMLSTELRSRYSIDLLKDRFESMMELASPVEPPDDVEVLDNGELGDSSLDDEGWAYVAIWTEAVTVTVKQFANRHLITDLIWGRP
jgi:hypothetical protein